MKKVLVTVAALGLVFGVAANALALDKPGRASETESVTAPVVAKATAPGVALWSVSGQWVLAGAYLSDGMGAPGEVDVNGEYDTNDAFYIYSFKILPTLQINDKVAVKGELRFADRNVWGFNDVSKPGGRYIDTYQLYLEYESPIGKTRFGRAGAGAWGNKFINSTYNADRIMLWTNFMPENWGMLLFTQKYGVSDEDAANPGVADQDKDAYYIDVSYKASFGKTIAAIWAVHNSTTDADDPVNGPYTSTDLWLNGNYVFGDVKVDWEMAFGFGDASSTESQGGVALYADLSTKVEDWTFGGLVIYGSGDTNTSDTDQDSGLLNSNGTGRDYNPFQIMMGDYMGMLNGDNPLNGGGINGQMVRGGGNTGVRAIGLYTGLAMSPKMSLSGELGYFLADSTENNIDDHYGTEFGVGLAYKLYDNLTYNAHFSYLWTGDFFAGDKGSPDPTNDVYLVAHALSMTF